MNNICLHSQFCRFGRLLGVLSISLALAAPLWAQKNSKGEEFFIISSVDQQTHQVVLMRPTQLTVAADFGAQTVCLGEKGEKMTPKDLRAGDTVWAILKTGKGGAASALRIREGAMTQAELQRLYLHYSTSAPAEPPVKPMPLNPPPQSGTSQAPPSGTAPVVSSDATLHRAPKSGRSRRHPQDNTDANF